MEKEMIGLASDHAGYDIKQCAKEWLLAHGFEVKDYGTYSTDSCDYPDYAHALARGIEDGEVSRGVAVCGSGVGISMALNKHQQIRAGLAWMPEIAHLTKLHNNANVLVLPGRFVDAQQAADILNAYFTTEFEGGRHQKRIDKIPV